MDDAILRALELALNAHPPSRIRCALREMGASVRDALWGYGEDIPMKGGVVIAQVSGRVRLHVTTLAKAYGGDGYLWEEYQTKFDFEAFMTALLDRLRESDGSAPN